MSRNASLNLNEINYDKPANRQIKLREEEVACVLSWSERIDFIQKSTQKVAKKLKNYEDAAFKNKTDKPKTDWTNTLCSKKGI